MAEKPPRTVAAVMLTISAILLSAPIVDYALSPRGDWLNPLGFEEWTEVPVVAWGTAIATAIFSRHSLSVGFPPCVRRGANSPGGSSSHFGQRRVLQL